MHSLSTIQRLNDIEAAKASAAAEQDEITQEHVDDAEQSGFEDGHMAGSESGYDAGYDAGFAEGHDKGSSDQDLSDLFERLRTAGIDASETFTARWDVVLGVMIYSQAGKFLTDEI